MITNRKLKKLIREGYFSSEELEFLKEIDKIEKLDSEEQLELIKKAQSGDKDSRDRVIKSNLELVAGKAVRHLDKGVSFLDLVQEGSIGLIKALLNFDPDKAKLQGDIFKYYATFWIDSAMVLATEKADLIKLPKQFLEFRDKVDRVTNALRMEYEREPAREEIANEMGVEVEKIEDLYLHSPEIENLDEPVENDEDEKILLKDICPSEDDFDENVEKLHLRKELLSTLDLIVENNPDLADGKKLLIKLYGFEGEDKTLEAASRDLNIPVYEARKLQINMMKKLRHPKYSKKISR